MADSLAPPRIEKPDIVVADAASLMHLASAGLLHLLHEAGCAVVVAHEIVRDPSKPGAEALRAWLAEGRAPGSNKPVRDEETETGLLYAAVLRAQPDYRLRNGGETAIAEWLAERVAEAGSAVIVLYENGHVPTIVRNQSLDADIDVLTTRAFLEGVERREREASADASAAAGPSYWARVLAASLTANPRLQSFSQRRTGEPS